MELITYTYMLVAHVWTAEQSELFLAKSKRKRRRRRWLNEKSIYSVLGKMHDDGNYSPIFYVLFFLRKFVKKKNKKLNKYGINTNV